MLKHDCGLDVLLTALLLDEEEKFQNVTRYILEFIEGKGINYFRTVWSLFID